MPHIVNITDGFIKRNKTRKQAMHIRLTRADKPIKNVAVTSQFVISRKSI
jgi:hypothetical protein